MMNLVRPLLAAAGGRPRLGQPLYQYWCDLAVELEMVTGHQTEVRTLEVAWREQKLSRKLRSSLRKLAQERAREDDEKFIKRVGEWIDWFETDAPLAAKEDVLLARTIIPILHRLSYLRGRVAVCRSVIELLEQDEISKAAEAAE